MPKSKCLFFVWVLTLGAPGTRAGAAEGSALERRGLADSAAARLGEAIRYATVSDAPDQAPLMALQGWLKEAYPRVFAALTVEQPDERALLMTWSGSDATLSPWVLMAHMDVVPAPEAELWEHAPFAGDVADGFVWGRGALDVKCGLVGIMEAVDRLVADGFRPRRTIYLAFGGDEEIGGDHGAKRIVQSLKTRGVRAGLVLDEGGYVVRGAVPGVDKPVALIGIAEKGELVLQLRSEVAQAGHASMPVAPGAVGLLAKALQRLEENPMPARLWGPTLAFLQALAPHADSPVTRLAFGHADFASPLLLRKLQASPGGQAMVRTTTALTMVRAGVKANVLPSVAEAVVDFRIAPFNTVADVRQHVEALVADLGIKLATYENTMREPSPVSRVDGDGYMQLTETIGEIFPDAAVAPYTTIGATDARYFYQISDRVYRFVPVLLDNDDLQRLHGHNERVSVDALGGAVAFYMALLRR